MAPVAVLITHRVLPGCRHQVEALWRRQLAPAIAANSGHEAYTYCTDPEDADVIVAFQRYADQADATAFLQTDAYRAYEQEVAPLLSGPPEVRPLTPRWSKP